MKNLLILFFFLVSFLIKGQVEIFKFSELEEIMTVNDGQVKVINFWATWCAPCVKELPYFENANNIYKEKGVDIVLINLDFVEQKQKVEKFIIKHNIKNRVVLLDEIDYNSWIDKVDSNWSGAIPATIFIGNKQRKFVEGELKQDQLMLIINEFITKK